MSPLLILSTTLSARAGDLVLCREGETDRALARVVVATDRPSAELTPRTMEALIAADSPRLLGIGTLDHCADAAMDLTTIQAALNAAEGHSNYMEYPEAIEKIDQALARLPCLNEPLDPDLAARLLLLRGHAAFAQGDSPKAWADFRQARLIAPELAWGDEFSTEVRPLFDGAGAELANTTPMPLAVTPREQLDRLWVDGRAADTVEIRRGRHLVQYEIGTTLGSVWLDLTSDLELTLVLPAAYPADAHTWAADAERRDALGALLAAAAPTETIYVPLDDIVWRFDGGDRVWTGTTMSGEAVTITAPEEPPPESEPSAAAPVEAPPPTPEPPPPEPARSRPQVALISGGVLLAGGGALTAISYSQALTALDDTSTATSASEWNAADQRYTEAQQRFVVGAAIAGVGAAVGVTGVVLSRLNTTAQLQLFGSGVQLAVTWE